MTRRILFDPSEYRDLNSEEQELLQVGYHKALEALRRNVTSQGFTACSLEDNKVYGTDANYRAIWARDGAKTVIWTLDLEDDEIAACQKATLKTILDHQAPSGQIPGHVLIDGGEAEYGGVGGITSIDSALWIVIAVWRHANLSGDWSLVEQYASPLATTVKWLSAQDSNNCGMLEIPEAGDWTDLFARSYHVLYDEVLWYRCLVAFGGILEHLGDESGGC